MTFKEKVYKACIESINKKIETLKQTLSDLKESASNETKSTAGDKHETALAMLQIEQENTNKQLETALLQKLQIVKINPAIAPAKVVTGSLVTTNKGIFYVSIAIGKITVDNIVIITLSPNSPLGNKMAGLTVNEMVLVNNISYVIESIL